MSAKEKAEIKVKLKLMSTLFRINSNFCLAFRNGVRRLKLGRGGMGSLATPGRGSPLPEDSGSYGANVSFWLAAKRTTTTAAVMGYGIFLR